MPGTTRCPLAGVWAAGRGACGDSRPRGGPGCQHTAGPPRTRVRQDPVRPRARPGGAPATCPRWPCSGGLGLVGAGRAAGPWCHTLGGEPAHVATLLSLGGLRAPCCLGFQAWALKGQGGHRRRAASAHTWAAGAAAPRARPAASMPASAVTRASLLSAGSPKPSPTGRSPPPRRRRCTWSQSTPSPGSQTSGSRSWWCCPGRSTSTSGWPATVRGGGVGPGRGGPSFPPKPRSWCSASLRTS